MNPARSDSCGCDKGFLLDSVTRYSEDALSYRLRGVPVDNSLWHSRSSACAHRVTALESSEGETLEDFRFEEVPTLLAAADPQTGRGRVSESQRTHHLFSGYRDREKALGDGPGGGSLPPAEAGALHDRSCPGASE
jgi:hypothetical protein